MSDKSPRRSAGKKPSKSVKEKRLIKKARKALVDDDRMAVFRLGEPPVGEFWKPTGFPEDPSVP